MSADWFCKIGDKQVGPLNNQQLKTCVAKGQLKPEHLVRRGSEGPWVPAGRIKGLFAPGAGNQSQGNPSPAAAKPLPKAAKSDPPRASKAAPLPKAAAVPPPPPDVPQEFAPGDQHKHHGQLNVDNLHLETTPVMVSRRKIKTGLQGLKKNEQKKATVILLSVICGGMAIGVIVFIWALSTGKFSTPKPESNPSIAALKAEDTSAKPIEKKPVDSTPAQAKWPTNWKKVSVETTVLGDVNLIVLKPRRGSPPPGVKITGNDKEVLIVPVNLQLKDGAKKDIDLTSWADEKLKKAVFLTDDKEGKGNSFELLAQVPKIGDMKAVTKERIQVQLIFEMPAEIPKTMYIALPGAAFHADGATIAYQFDKDDVGPEPKTATGAAAGGERAQAANGGAN
jgi:hypothetical protein